MNLCHECGEDGKDAEGRPCRTCGGLGAVPEPEPDLPEEIAIEFAAVLDVLGIFEANGPSAVLDLVGGRRDGFDPVGLAAIRAVQGELNRLEQVDRQVEAEEQRRKMRVKK